MRILHLVPLHVPARGIVRQAIAEHYAAVEAGLEWHVRLFTDVDLPAGAEILRISTPARGAVASSSWIRNALDKLSHRRALYQWLQDHHAEYDVVLLRYTTSDIARGYALRRISTPVVSVHHTLEIPELSLDSGYRRWLRVSTERLAARRNLRSSAAIAGVTREIVDYELSRAEQTLPWLTFPNGIDLGEHHLADDRRAEVPELLFIASTFAPWHGLDRLLDSIEGSAAEFVLHLAGTLDASDLQRAQADPRIRIHGLLDQQQISDLIAQSWVGLSSFAMDRNGMAEASSLKVREYLASGLPTYSGHADRFPATAQYYREGPPEIEAVLEYSRQMRTVSRHEVRMASGPEISKATILTETAEQLRAMLHL